MDAIKKYKIRREQRLNDRGVRLDEDEDGGRWVTTENGHKIHINEEGEPDKGNPHVLGVMAGKTKKEIKGIVNGFSAFKKEAQNAEFTTEDGSKIRVTWENDLPSQTKYEKDNKIKTTRVCVFKDDKLILNERGSESSNHYKDSIIKAIGKKD